MQSLTPAELDAATTRWQEEQRRLDYRTAVIAGFADSSATVIQIFPSLAPKKSQAEIDEQAGIEAFKAMFGYPGPPE